MRILTFGELAGPTRQVRATDQRLRLIANAVGAQLPDRIEIQEVGERLEPYEGHATLVTPAGVVLHVALHGSRLWEVESDELGLFQTGTSRWIKRDGWANRGFLYHAGIKGLRYKEPVPEGGEPEGWDWVDRVGPKVLAALLRGEEIDPVSGNYE